MPTADDPCSIEGCHRRRSSRGWCNTHYERWRVHGSTEMPAKTVRPRRADCSVDGCENESQPSHGICKKHYKAQWHQQNRERSAAAQRERKQGWRAENPERCKERAREAARRRYELIKDAAPVDFSSILDEHGMTCHLCGGPIDGPSDLHFDHVIPLSKGGPHVADNIRPAHRHCNMRKGASLLPIGGGHSRWPVIQQQ